MEDSLAALVVFIMSLPLIVLNLVTIAVIICDQRLRKIPSNYPIGSFLLGSAIQGMIAAPIYVYKKLIDKEDVRPWVCDISRVFYFVCGHTMKMSLLVISFDRMLAIKYPFRYEKVTRTKMLSVLATLWIVTLSVDMIPFAGTSPNECLYVPTQIWGLTVIIMYNIIPFCVSFVNYFLIWLIAVKFEMKDKFRAVSLQYTRQTKTCDVKGEDGNKSMEKQRILQKNDPASLLKFAFEMKATKTSLSLLFVYIVCWGPLGLFYMVDHFCRNCLSGNDKLRRTQLGIKLLCFSSSFWSPLIYCWANGGYRKAAKRLICKLRMKDIVYTESNLALKHKLSDSKETSLV